MKRVMIFIILSSVIFFSCQWGYGIMAQDKQYEQDKEVFMTISYNISGEIVAIRGVEGVSSVVSRPMKLPILFKEVELKILDTTTLMKTSSSPDCQTVIQNGKMTKVCKVGG